jgi:hypothetical protein
MVFLVDFAVIVPTVGFDFFKNIDIWEVIKELANEQSIKGKLEGVAGKFFSEIGEDVGNGGVQVSG